MQQQQTEDTVPGPRDLADLLDRLEEAARDQDQISAGLVVSAVGERSFGTLLLVAGLITLAPLVGDIPGVPTLMASLVALIAVQLLFGRHEFWLPEWLLGRSLARDKVERVIGWLRPVASFLDRVSRRRLAAITRGHGVRLIALACLAVAVAMPPMELIPFSANGAGAALTLFGLGLVAQDGLLAGLGLAVTAGAVTVVAVNLV